MKIPLKTFENKDTHAKMLGAVMQRGRKKHKNPSYLFRVVRQDNMKLNRTRNRAFKHLESHKQQNPSFVGLAVVHFVHSSRASLHYLRGPGNKFSRIFSQCGSGSEVSNTSEGQPLFSGGSCGLMLLEVRCEADSMVPW